MASVWEQRQVLDIRELLRRLQVRRLVWCRFRMFPCKRMPFYVVHGGGVLFCQVSGCLGVRRSGRWRHTGSAPTLWSHSSLVSSSPPSSSWTGSQPSSSTNRLSDRKVGGGGLCDGRRSKAPIRDALALATLGCGVGFGACGRGGASGIGRNVGGAWACDCCGASNGTALALRDAASRRGPSPWTAFLRPFLVFWLGLPPRSPTVMMRNSHEMDSLAYDS